MKPEDAERNAALIVANLMLVAAKTTPRARGLDTNVNAMLPESINIKLETKRNLSEKRRISAKY
jgi:uncharacterized ferredoxin-like protein